VDFVDCDNRVDFLDTRLNLTDVQAGGLFDTLRFLVLT